MQDFRVSRQSARAAPVARRRQRDSGAARLAEFVEYERVYRLKIRFLKLLFHAFLERVAPGHGPRADEFRSNTSSGKATCCIVLPCMPRWTKRCTRTARTCGTGGPGPNSIRIRNRPRCAEFARKHWRSVLFHKYMQWQLDLQLASAQQHARQRGLAHRPVSRPGAGHRPLRRRSVGASRFLRLRVPRGRAAGRLLAQRPGLGLSAAQFRAPLSGRLPACSPNPSARTAGTAARCASITSCASSACTGFRTAWKPPRAPTFATAPRSCSRILALESVRKRSIVIGEDLGTVPDEVREVLHRFGILSYRLLYFEQDHERTFSNSGRVSARRAGVGDDARSADAGRVLAGPGHRCAPRSRPAAR